MKHMIVAALVLIFTQALHAQTEVSRDASGNKVLRGFISRNELAADTAFAWFQENQKGYVPHAEAVQALRIQKDSINFIAFGGTWCGDTKNILPKFYALTDAAGFSQDRITLIGVDRSKKTIQHLAEAFNIINVPTLIVMKNGKEVGRVVEYGKYGMFDKELGEIISAARR